MPHALRMPQRPESPVTGVLRAHRGTMKTILGVMAVVGMIAGCKQDPTTTKTVPADDPKAAASNLPASAVPLAAEDKTFITTAAQGSMLEVQLGQIASQKATSPDVKAFGSQMVADHGRANTELSQLAAKKGWQVPTTLDKDHQEMVDKIAKLNGSEFDQKYASSMVDDHEDDIKQFKNAAKDAKDPDLKAWAAQKVTLLDAHLMMAKDAKAKTK